MDNFGSTISGVFVKIGSSVCFFGWDKGRGEKYQCNIVGPRSKVFSGVGGSVVFQCRNKKLRVSRE